MKFSKVLFPTLLVLLGSVATVRATDKWFDINGTTAGGGPDGSGFYDGAWDTTTANWNTDPTGVAATTTWTDGDIAHFYAGNDPTAFGGITISGSINPGGLEVEEGKVQLVGTGLNMGANPWKVDNGAEFVISNLNQVTFAAPGSVLTLDGGKFTNLIVGGGSGILSGTNSSIQLTANGGTINTPNGGPTGVDSDTSAYSIMVYTNSITMASGVTSATLHKTGHGELRALTNWNFTNLAVDQGLYRINGTGGTETGFGAATGTVTVAGGALENTSQGAALGTSIGIASPTTRSFVLSGVGATKDSEIVLNAGWTINGPISGPGGFILNGWERGDAGAVIGSQTQILTLNGTNTYGGQTTIGFGTIIANGGHAIPDTSRVSISTRSLWGNGTQSTFNTAVFQVGTSTVAATETIGSLDGGNATRGTVSILNVGSALITGADGTSSTFSGTISGAGSLQKTGGGTFTMDGVKSYTGDTKVLGGTLSTTTASLADTADVYVNSGALFNLNFSGPDTIKSLFLNGAAQAIGTWGGAGSGAANISALLSGSGILNVTSAGAPPGVAGDYNGNGVVDMADFVLWRNGGPLQNEVNTIGTVDASDYDAWRARFGNTSGSGSGLGAGTAVPEPATLALVLLGGLGLIARRRDR